MSTTNPGDAERPAPNQPWPVSDPVDGQMPAAPTPSDARAQGLPTSPHEAGGVAAAEPATEHTSGVDAGLPPAA
ncbi:MAG: hypothetical protein EB027_07110, partial [Actinobacteria bacterium]|nr:hypothetical protein [Actinomycetota bacterium]